MNDSRKLTSTPKRVVFENQPKLTEHEADRTFNDARRALVARLENFIASHHYFSGGEVQVSFPERGASSLVAIINDGKNTSVLKIPLSLTLASGEALFLRVWEQAGVKVPKIIEEGNLEGHPYLLMEYINAKTLVDTFSPQEMKEKGIRKEMGRTLRRMHEPKTKGYGRCTENGAEFSTFKEWLESSDMKRRIEYVKEHNLLGDEHGSLVLALETLIAHVEKNPESSYCHDDFGGANIFATEPLTVFDPNPRFNNRYLDLGRSVQIPLAFKVPPSEFLEGYFEHDACDEKVVRASMLLNAYMKFPYWHKVKRHEHISNTRAFFEASP